MKLNMQRILCFYLLGFLCVLNPEAVAQTEIEHEEIVKPATEKPFELAANLGFSSWLLGAQVTGVGQGNTANSGPFFDPTLSFGPDTHFGWSGSASIYAAVSFWKGGFFMGEGEYANGRGMPN